MAPVLNVACPQRRLSSMSRAQLSGGAQLSGAQSSVFRRRSIGPWTVGPLQTVGSWTVGLRTAESVEILELVKLLILNNFSQLH